MNPPYTKRRLKVRHRCLAARCSTRTRFSVLVRFEDGAEAFVALCHAHRRAGVPLDVRAEVA